MNRGGVDVDRERKEKEEIALYLSVGLGWQGGCICTAYTEVTRNGELLR
jgi:hypothetical protein